MFRLQNLNIIIETDDEIKKDELLSKGYELIETKEIEKTEDIEEDTTQSDEAEEENVEEDIDNPKKSKKTKK